MAELSKPHDKFFKRVFTRKETAADFLRNYLPDNIVDLMDLDSLEYEKDSFVDEELSESLSDLLIKVSMQESGAGYVYILFEHKSYHEPFIAFYLLKYMVKIWDAFAGRKGQSDLPVILPIVLYHGKEKWRAGSRFQDLIKNPGQMAEYIPDYRYVLWDASRYTEDEIKGEIITRVALLLLKYIFDDSLRDRLPGIFELMKGLGDKKTGLEYLKTVVKYVLKAASAGNISYEDIKATAEKSYSETGGEQMQTVADTLIEQGKKEGLRQGALNNTMESVIEILEIRFQTVPLELEKKIRAIKDPSILRILMRDAVKSVTVDDFTEFAARIL